jgi:hypothetical protein
VRCRGKNLLAFAFALKTLAEVQERGEL